MRSPYPLRPCGWLCLLVFSAAGSVQSAETKVDFDRDIRPILSNNCYKCHGPDPAHREAGLRLDEKEGALKKLDSGEAAVVPGDRAKSALWQRITVKDDERMPPPGSDKSLTAKQIELLGLWIDQGASWKQHWAFVSPQRPSPPAVKQQAWVRNPVDRFVLARLEAEGLAPAAEAEKLVLIRRATLDLTGLPPTLAEIDAFLADASPDAYEKLVDRLLASPRYGEQMTRYWLDVARYGDSHGLHLDNERAIWPYRDWLIRAFNENKPFDQFTVEQLAGDLLPSPTLEQRVATGFNRCNVTTSEGGAIDEEFRVRYAIDRTETLSTTWLGLTVGCAVCHDHKFDPLTLKDFYSLYAFYYSAADPPMDGNALMTPPVVRIPSPEQLAEQDALRKQVAAVQAKIDAELAKIDYKDPGAAPPAPAEPKELVWIDDALPPGAKPQGDVPGWQFVSSPEPVFRGTKSHVRLGAGRSQHFFTDANPGLRIGEGDKLFAYVYLDPKNPPKQLMLQWNDGTWEHRAYWGSDLIEWGQAGTPSRFAAGPLPAPGNWVRLEIEAAKVGLRPGAVVTGWAFTQFDGHAWWDVAGSVTKTPQGGQDFESLAAWAAVQRAAGGAGLPEPVKQAIVVDPAKQSPAQQKTVRDHFLQQVHPKAKAVFAPLQAELAATNKKLADLEARIPASLVMGDANPPRQAFILKRGQYDKPGEKVDRGVPAVLPPLPAGAPANRLGLAQWLVMPTHPLTARVTVNRFWQQYFGVGLVKTAEDFGMQGQAPSHPELLDWLAVEFMTDWNVKRLQRLIVTSATYRQTSRAAPELYHRDPENRLLARGPRFRMDAEMVRDTSLSVGGLLVGKIGGPSVKPYQPSGLWEAISYPSSTTARFVQDHGEALYRRSMYTFWKRTSPPPSLQLLDAPSRETCTARRPRTNTPVAALALMNDIQYFESARALAQRTMLEGGPTPESRATYAFRLATGRPPQPDELALLLEQYRSHLADFKLDMIAAEKMSAIGEAKRDPSLDIAELAAWTMIANTILNLDETLTKG